MLKECEVTIEEFIPVDIRISVFGLNFLHIMKKLLSRKHKMTKARKRKISCFRN